YRGTRERSEIIVDASAVYHNKLKQKLNMLFPAAPINILNVGISGDTAEGGLKRLNRDIIRHEPDLVVVCYGLNDSGQGIARAEAYGSALKEIFLQLKKTDSQVIFMTPNMKN